MEIKCPNQQQLSCGPVQRAPRDLFAVKGIAQPWRRGPEATQPYRHGVVHVHIHACQLTRLTKKNSDLTDARKMQRNRTRYRTRVRNATSRNDLHRSGRSDSHAGQRKAVVHRKVVAICWVCTLDDSRYSLQVAAPSRDGVQVHVGGETRGDQMSVIQSTFQSGKVRSVGVTDELQTFAFVRHAVFVR